MYKAAVLVSPQRMEIEKREELELGESEVLIKVKFAEVCGTDIALLSDEYGVHFLSFFGMSLAARL